MSMSYTNAATYSITAQRGVFGKHNILLWGPLSSAVQHLGKPGEKVVRDQARLSFWNELKARLRFLPELQSSAFDFYSLKAGV